MGDSGGIFEISVAPLELSLTIADNNGSRSGSGSGQIDPISLEAAAEEYAISYLNVAFPVVNANSINVTLTPVQTTTGSPKRSTVARYTLYVTITYLPSGGEDSPITITIIALGDLLLTQLGSDDFVSAHREDDAQIGALVINTITVPSPTPAHTPHPLSCQRHISLSFIRHLSLSNQRPFPQQC